MKIKALLAALTFFTLNSSLSADCWKLLPDSKEPEWVSIFLINANMPKTFCFDPVSAQLSPSPHPHKITLKDGKIVETEGNGFNSTFLGKNVREVTVSQYYREELGGISGTVLSVLVTLRIDTVTGEILTKTIKDPSSGEIKKSGFDFSARIITSKDIFHTTEADYHFPNMRYSF